MAIEYISKAGALYIVTKMKELLSKKVDAVDGKTLTTNDFTTAEKNKLEGIATGATKVIVDASLSSSTNAIQNKAVNTALGGKAPLSSPTFTGTPKAPTALEGNNTTQIATTAFVTNAVGKAISGVTGIKFEKVESLPASGKDGVIYLVPNSSSISKNIYDEYIWTGSAFEKIGTTEQDLSGYLKSSDLVEVSNGEIDAMFK